MHPAPPATAPAETPAATPPAASWVEEPAPGVEEFSENGQVVVRFEAPGIDPGTDVEITIHGGILRLRVERRRDPARSPDRVYRSEFRYGTHRRSIALPPGTTEDEVSATYRDGIVEVRIPLVDEHAAGIRVPVTRP